MKRHAFGGNKRFLDSKPCAACGRTMTWRRKWARDWANVRYCSDACRRTGRPAAVPPSASADEAGAP